MLVTSKLCNDRVYSQYAFGFLNFGVVEFVEMIPRECWSCCTDCFACYFSAKCIRLQPFWTRGMLLVSSRRSCM